MLKNGSSMIKKIPIEFTENQLAVLNEALINIPYKHSAPIIQHINLEIQKCFDRNVDSRDIPSGAPDVSSNE